jgi:adenylate kinase
MTNGVTILVFGISGVGKTSLIQSSVKDFPNALRWRASDIISQAREMSDPERLRLLPPAELMRSQELLVEGFRARRKLSPSELVILDAHSVIDTDEGFFEVPLAVVSELRPTGIVYVASEATQIASQRTSDRSRVRPTRSPTQLAEYQARSIQACEHYSEALEIPLIRVGVGNSADFAHAIDVITGVGNPRQGETR